MNWMKILHHNSYKVMIFKFNDNFMEELMIILPAMYKYNLTFYSALSFNTDNQFFNRLSSSSERNSPPIWSDLLNFMMFQFVCSYLLFLDGIIGLVSILKNFYFFRKGKIFPRDPLETSLKSGSRILQDYHL